jgi:hypothetical protein
MSGLSGQCLCGAVRIVLSAAPEAASACHCGRCRRWSGAAMWGCSVPARNVQVTGTVTRHRGARFAERAWCPSCGTHLWIRDDGADYDLMPGLFDGLAELPLSREVYADLALACVKLAGDHDRITAAAYERTNPHLAEGDMP